MGRSNFHERPEDIGRPRRTTAEQDEHDPLTFERMARAAGQSDRLLRLQGRLLRHSAELAEAREEGEDGA